MAAGTATRRPAVRSSFHSTICVLEGLLEYEKANGPSAEVTAARLRGQEYLLERRLLRSRSTGRWSPSIGNSGSPPRGRSVRFPPAGTMTFCGASTTCGRAGVAPDERIAEAIDLIAKKRDGVDAGRSRIRIRVASTSRWKALPETEPLEHASRAPRAALGRCDVKVADTLRIS